MAVFASRQIVMPVASVAVRITGTGDDYYCSVIINGTKYYARASGLEVNSGDIITFTICGTGDWEGSIEIDGTVFKTATSPTGTSKSYNWTVPYGITNIVIQLYYNNVHTYSEITVTTS